MTFHVNDAVTNASAFLEAAAAIPSSPPEDWNYVPSGGGRIPSQIHEWLKAGVIEVRATTDGRAAYRKRPAHAPQEGIPSGRRGWVT